MHTRPALVDQIIEVTNRDHPNETVQILTVPVVQADPAYQQWVIDSTT